MQPSKKGYTFLVNKHNGNGGNYWVRWHNIIIKCCKSIYKNSEKNHSSGPSKGKRASKLFYIRIKPRPSKDQLNGKYFFNHQLWQAMDLQPFTLKRLISRLWYLFEKAWSVVIYKILVKVCGSTLKVFYALPK